MMTSRGGCLKSSTGTNDSRAVSFTVERVGVVLDGGSGTLTPLEIQDQNDQGHWQTHSQDQIAHNDNCERVGRIVMHECLSNDSASSSSGDGRDNGQKERCCCATEGMTLIRRNHKGNANGRHE